MAKEKKGIFAKLFSQRVNEFPTEFTVTNAWKKGDIKTKLSFIVMGLGEILNHQYIKGLMYLLIEIAFFAFMFSTGIHNLAMLPGLGEAEQGKVWNEALGVYEYTQGDNSVLILLFGIATLFIVAGFIIIWRASVKGCYKSQWLKEHGKKLPTLKQDIAALFDGELQKTLLTAPVMGIVIFTILPLVFMICMAFTNYSKVGQHLVLFDWVGLKNFGEVLNFGSVIGEQFWSVLGWTLIWAVLATFLNYIFGMILAIIINRKETKGKAFWRFCFVLSVAVPQFVSLMIMRSVLQPQGAVNVILQNMGWIDSPLPFYTNATWARCTVVIINLWVGIPYTLLNLTGILQNIPGELYESAKVDGANAFTTFWKITLPYMLFVTTPNLITTFTGNINNFNVIYLLSGGDPTPVGHTAGKTDLLVTWLYKLTIDQQQYNIGAVIGILTFVVLSIVSLVTYHNTGSYKNEEGFM
jgi:arabinogalactan oligomer/maltooligosaccharide transport system permease protein